MPEIVYADCNAHIPPCPPVRDHLLKRLAGEDFANPNASHKLGEKIHLSMEKSRKRCAEVLGAQKEQILFNSGASEGIPMFFTPFWMPKVPHKAKRSSFPASSITSSFR